MYLNTYLDMMPGVNITEYALENTTYSNFYYYWRDELFQRVCRLFVEKTDPIPPKEIEIRLMMTGHCGIMPLRDKRTGKDELTAFFGTFNGISKYSDEKPFYCVHSPVYSGNHTIGKDIEVISNNTLRNPLYDMIHHYAMILAHSEVTYIVTMVNARNSGGTPVAKTHKQYASIKDFLGKLFNGKFDAVEDIGELGVEYAGVHTSTMQPCEAIWNTRQRILSSFLSDIGVKSGIDKRSNTVSEEINADTPSLLINLNDMLHAREEGFDKVNKHFGTSWTVELNPDINYINYFTDPNVDFNKKGEENEEDN